MRKITMAILLSALVTGCGTTNGLLGTEDQDTVIPSIDPGITAEDVVKLYLSYQGYGSYVLAYELLTDEQKRETTIEDIQTYAEMGKTELEKVLSIQEQGDLTLVSAAVRFTDEQTKEVRYEIQDFLLAKDGGEWRIIEEGLLSKEQVKTFADLTVQKAKELQNNGEVQEFMAWMKGANAELGAAAKEVLSEQLSNAKDELSDAARANGGMLEKGLSDFVQGRK